MLPAVKLQCQTWIDNLLGCLIAGRYHRRSRLSLSWGTPKYQPGFVTPQNVPKPENFPALLLTTSNLSTDDNGRFASVDDLMVGPDASSQPVTLGQSTRDNPTVR